VRRLLAPLVCLVALASACGSPSPHAPYPAAPLPSPAAVNGLADLPQDLSLAPGQRNTWDLGRGFALESGGDDQFVFPGAMQLHLGLPATPPTADSIPGDFPDLLPFPYDQAWGELAWTTPLSSRGAAPLSALVASGNTLLGREVVLAGSFGLPAVGGGLAGTRLSQAVDLTGVTPPVTLSWKQHGLLLDGTIASGAASWSVVVRDTASGTARVAASNILANGPVGPIDVSAMAGKQVAVVFELRGSPRSAMAVDQVTLTAAGNELLVNGGFEGAALAPWSVSGPDQPCQVVSGKRTLHGLEVERRVFARPDLRWARFVDVFRNPGVAAVTTEVNYLHELGAGQDAVIQRSGGQKALSAWDGGGVGLARRDLAIVFGTSALPAAFRSATSLGTGGGSSNVWTRFPLTVPAGQVKVVVQFVVLAESRTGDLALDAAARAARVDQEADAIAAGFWPTTSYREGMTAEQVAAIVNW
jgi:hypothetical protein